MKLSTLLLLPLCSSLAPTRSARGLAPPRSARGAARRAVVASVDDAEVTKVLARLRPDIAPALFAKADGGTSRFLTLDRFAKRFDALVDDGGGARPARATTDALWRALGGYAPERVVAKPKGFLDVLRENVMGTPEQFSSMQKDAFGNTVRNPVGESLSEAQLAEAFAALGTDREVVGAALARGMDAVASNARLEQARRDAMGEDA